MEKKKKKDLDRYLDNIEPIHEMHEDEIQHALDATWDQIEALYTYPNMKPEKSRGYIENQIEFNLERLANSFRQSLIYFYPEREKELSEVIDANEAWWSMDSLMASRIIPTPLHEGFEALLKIFSMLGCYKTDYRTEDKDAMLSDFREMEQALKKYIGIAKEYYFSKKTQEVEELVEVAKKVMQGAKEGPPAKAESYKERNQYWQKIADEEWPKNARRSKESIAKIIIKRITKDQTIDSEYKERLLKSPGTIRKVIIKPA